MTNLSSRNRRLLQNHDTLVQWFQRGVNAIIIVITLFVIAYWREGEVQSQYRAVAGYAVLIALITYHLFGVHRRFESLLGGVQQLARAWGVVIIVLAWLAFLTKTSEAYSRQVITYWAVVAFVAQAFTQLLISKLYRIYSLKYRERVPTLVVGTGRVAHHLTRSLKKNIWLRDEVVGVIAIEDNEIELEKVADVDILGMSTEIFDIISEKKIRKVYLAPKFDQNGYVRFLQESLIDANIDLVWAPDIFEFHLLNHSVREVAGLPLITLNETPLMSGGPAFIKMLMDKSAALLLIVMLLPLLVGVALAVKLSSEGPIIFKQRRGGWDGKRFNVYKFRSMYLHEPDKVVKQASKNDPRITKVGAFLRRTSLDELPQLFNILNGSMSLVGPRPHAESHDKFYSTKVRKYLARHRIKPGMTGLAQINGLRGETNDLESMEQRIEFDLEYISNWSPILDMKILFLTPFALMARNEKAY